MNALFTILLIFFIQDIAPYKPSDEFELKMNYELRPRPLPENNRIDFEERKNESGMLPYLSLTLQVLKVQPGEDRIRIATNFKDQILNKKIKIGTGYSFDLGFTVDMKDRVKAHEYTILFQTSDRKQTISKIVINVGEDGSFLVNNEKRGRL
jgi:hypothetical protein